MLPITLNVEMQFFGCGGPSEDDLKQINKGLKAQAKTDAEKIKRLEKQHTEDIERFNEYRSAADKREKKYYADQDESNAAYQKKLRREQQDEIEAAEDAADKKVRAAEKAADERVRAAELKVGNTDVAVRTAVLKEKESNLTATTTLEVEVAAESARADGAESQVEQLETELDEMTSLMKDFAKTNTSFADAVLKKLPNVDLTKMSVNIEMPAPEVTVVNGNKGGDQKGGK